MHMAGPPASSISVVAAASAVNQHPHHRRHQPHDHEPTKEISAAIPDFVDEECGGLDDDSDEAEVVS